MKDERVKIGVPGLDKIIQNGLAMGSVNLVTGGTGTGKSIFGGQFLWYGLQHNEPGVFISSEETPEDIKNDWLKFGWDFEKYEKKKKFIIKFADPFGVRDGFSIFEEADFTSIFTKEVKKINAKRLVVDSISVLGLYLKDLHELRKKLFMLVQDIKKTGVTAILTSEIQEGSNKISRFGIEEFIVDGVIVLRSVPLGKIVQRTLEVKKMRRTKIEEGTHSMEFYKDGIKVVD